MTNTRLPINSTQHELKEQVHHRGGPPTGVPATPATQTPFYPRIRLQIGDVVACAQPTVLETVLGSCVTVCLGDPISGVRGMNHFLLPAGGDDSKCSRFGVHAMELLINQVMTQGGDRRRLVAKAFGAGNVIRGMKRPTVGDLNQEFVREFLARERIALVASRLGGKQAVRVQFQTASGKVIVHAVDNSLLQSTINTETSYQRRHPADRDDSGEALLF